MALSHQWQRRFSNTGCGGMRWLSAMLSVKVPWADRVMALPFLTLLASAKRFHAAKTRAPKTLLDWAPALQIHRWLPDRYIVVAAASSNISL
jgi:hypothetical protein